MCPLIARPARPNGLDVPPGTLEELYRHWGDTLDATSPSNAVAALELPAEPRAG